LQQLLQPKPKAREGRHEQQEPEQLSPEVLSQYTDSEHWYRHALNRKIVFTDGAKHVADHGSAYWCARAGPGCPGWPRSL
jgi:hypothetical protein